jgi:energy-coupling factor transporter ATP-binding protein EcfA2
MDTRENIILIYGFNSSGKTQLSVAYKDWTKLLNGDKHVGVYYNAFSEDLFQWHNDIENGEIDIKLNVIQSSLNEFHSFIMDDKEKLLEKLKPYNPNYTFKLNPCKDANGTENQEKGIGSITFYHKEDADQTTPIKISRGEERIFVWCFFLTLFEIDGWIERQNAHFFIDDPVSSLDDHNIFITADSIMNIIDINYLEKRIIITTHHIGLFSILADRLKRGEKSDRYKHITKIYTLSRTDDGAELNSPSSDVFLFHLHLMKTLHEAKDNEILQYHFVLLRQLLENISSFLGKGGISYTLSQIGFSDKKLGTEQNTEVERIVSRINSLSHKDTYKPEPYNSSDEDGKLMKNVLEKIQMKYHFVFKI